MKKFFEEFKKFITRGNVVDMAIGVAVAGAFTKIVNSFTNGFVSPVVGLITGGANLSEQKWILRPEVVEVLEDGTEKVVTPESALLWGTFVQNIIDFLIIAFVLFIIMKIFNQVMTKAKEVSADIKDDLKPNKIKEAEEAAAKAEAEKKAAEEAARKAAEDEAMKYLEMVDLAKFADSYPKELSGGMKQRVAIARAYAAEPGVLLMDEPFGALDAQTRTQLQSELIQTWQEEKKTCFFITHDVEEAIILATKVIVMSARPGRIKRIIDINLPYPRTQDLKMQKEFLDLTAQIWGEVYQEYLEVRR